MDLNFSGAEVAAISTLLTALVGAFTYVGRQLLAAKQDTIERQARTIEKQDLVTERSIQATNELREVVRDQARNVEGLRVQMVELTRELIDRRPVINSILEQWQRQHDTGERRPGDR